MDLDFSGEKYTPAWVASDTCTITQRPRLRSKDSAVTGCEPAQPQGLHATPPPLSTKLSFCTQLARARSVIASIGPADSGREVRAIRVTGCIGCSVLPVRDAPE